MRHLRLAHHGLPFWIDVRLRDFEGRWLAVADLADQPDIGTGRTAAEAVPGALAAFGSLALRISSLPALDWKAVGHDFGHPRTLLRPPASARGPAPPSRPWGPRVHVVDRSIHRMTMPR